MTVVDGDIEEKKLLVAGADTEADADGLASGMSDEAEARDDQIYNATVGVLDVDDGRLVADREFSASD